MPNAVLNDARRVIKWALVLLIVFAFIAYLVEFILLMNGSGAYLHDNRKASGHVGYIFLFIFVVIFIIIGLTGTILEHHILMVVFTVGFLIMVVIDASLIGSMFAIVMGSLTVIVAAVFTYIVWKK